MSFKVRNGRGEKILGTIGLILFTAMAAGMIALGIESLLEGHADIFYVYLFFAVLIGALGVLSIIFMVRPRADVEGDRVVYYPQWGRKRVIDINDITKKVTLHRRDNSAPVMGGLLGGLLWYGATGGRQGAMCDYTYMCGTKEVMRIGDRMKNAELLDKIITDRLREKREQAEEEE